MIKKTYMIEKDENVIASGMPLDEAVDLLRTLAFFAPSRIDSWTLTVDYVEEDGQRPQERKEID